MHELWELKQKQSLPLSEKINASLDLIRDWYEHWGGQVYISFSGGKDSTVLLDLARKIYPDIEAVYIDTGLEYPEIKTFVKSFDNVTIIRPEMNFRKVIEKYGYPLISKEVANIIRGARKGKSSYIRYCKVYDFDSISDKYTKRYDCSRYKYLADSDIPISEQCCDVMKKKPAKVFEKKSGKKPIIATMANESALRQTSWLRYGCNVFEGKRESSRPLSFWTEQDILEYLSKFNIPYASVYGDIIKDDDDKYKTTKCTRTGCVFCGFGCHLEKEPNRFQMLKETHPKLHEYCMRPLDEGGLGMKDVLEFINVKYE